jgi:cytochrome P450
MKDALELHTVRTLALIASASDAVRQRLLLELGSVTSPTTAALANLYLLEACIKEEARLWTADPLLLRVAVNPTNLSDGTEIAQGRQILLTTGFYHRDAEVFGDAAERFSPEDRALADTPDSTSMTNSKPPLYIFSAHRQACAGQFLVVLLLKAVLASLLIQMKKVPRPDRSVPMNPVPAAINHFAIRFWRNPTPGAS